MRGDEIGERVALELLDAQRNALALDVDGNDHRFDFVTLLVIAHRLFAGNAPGKIGQVNQAVDATRQADEDSEVCDRLDLATDLVAFLVIGGELFPGIGLALLHAQRNAAAVLVDLENHHLHLVAELHHARGVNVLVGPVHLGHVHQPLDALLDLDERAVVGDVLDDALDGGAFLQRREQLLALGACGLLEHGAARYHHVVALAVELDDLEFEILAFVGVGVLHRADVHQRTGQEGANAVHHDREPAFDLAVDQALHQGTLFHRLFQIVPGGQALGLFPRQAGFPVAILESFDCDGHIVAGLDLEFAAVVLELVCRDEAFRLQAGVHHDEIGIYTHHFGRDDFSCAHLLSRQAFLEHRGKVILGSGGLS